MSASGLLVPLDFIVDKNIRACVLMPEFLYYLIYGKKIGHRVVGSRKKKSS